MKLFLFLSCLVLAASCSKEPSEPHHKTVRDADFDTALGCDRLGVEFICKNKKDQARYSACRALWEKNRPSHVRLQREVLIQKSIHQFWLSDEPMPKRLRKCQQTWTRQHPGWKYKLWTLKDVSALSDEERVPIEQANSEKLKEDLLRAYVLDAFGGVCVDIAADSLAPLDELHSTYHFYTCFEPPLPKKQFGRKLHLATSFIGASRGHPIIKRWRELLVEKLTSAERSSYLLFGKAIDQELQSTQFINVVFPPTYAFPVRPQCLKRFEKNQMQQQNSSWIKIAWQILKPADEPLFSNIQPESFAVSTTGGSWQQTKKVKEDDGK